MMGSAAAAGMMRPSMLSSANDTIRIGRVGLNGRGMSHIQSFSGLPNVEVAALCDIDQSVMAKRLQALARATKRPTPCSHGRTARLLWYLRRCNGLLNVRGQAKPPALPRILSGRC
jgi:hypothetical protein